MKVEGQLRFSLTACYRSPVTYRSLHNRALLHLCTALFALCSGGNVAELGAHPDPRMLLLSI